jgi:predicted acylesterase/phospholipase RssA
VRELEARGVPIHHLLTVSAGGLTGVPYALGRLDLALERWERVESDRILRFAPRLRPFSLVSDQPVFDSFEFFADEQRARGLLRAHLTIVALCRDRREHVYGRFSPGGEEPWDAPLSRYLAGSCAIPYLFPPVEVTREGVTRRLIDGGVETASRADFRRLAGCRDLLILEVEDPHERSARRGLRERLDPTRRLSNDHFIDEGIASLAALEQPPRVLRFWPRAPLPYGFLRFRREDCLAAVAQGERDLAGLLSEPERYEVELRPGVASTGGAGDSGSSMVSR